VSEEAESDSQVNFYKFSYLYKIGGKGTAGIFFSKRSWDFYLSVILTVVGSVAFFSGRNQISALRTFLTVAIPVSGALLGLVLASYAIISSIDDQELLKKLIASGYYQYAIFQFTWSGLFLMMSTLFGIALLLIGSSMRIIFSSSYPIEMFFLVYGVLGAFFSFFYDLRHLAIMNGRSTSDLKQAWRTYEDRALNGGKNRAQK